MSSDEQTVMKTSEEDKTTNTTSSAPAAGGGPSATEGLSEQVLSEKAIKAKELYSHGSRNFLLKSFAEAADELSQVCSFYEELYGELSDELGMPYLLYAKSLIALALDENKVIDVPDEEEDDDDDDDGEEEPDLATGSTNGVLNDRKLEKIAEYDANTTVTEDANKKSEEILNDKHEKVEKDSEVTSTEDDKIKDKKEDESSTNGRNNGVSEVPHSSSIQDDVPSTSNGDVVAEEEDEETEAASNLQLAWEILELAAKIFSRQGERGLPNLAEVQTELANIEFENNILEAAREDYEKALNIYKELPNNYRRAMAEIHYKIGLSFLMQQQNKEGAFSLKEACKLIAGEIDEIRTKPELSEKDKNNIQDMEETKQEIEAKITEIEETQAQNIAEVRAALDSYIKPLSSADVDGGSSKSDTAVVAPLTATPSSAITSSSKPTDISHLIKRKKPEDPTSEADAAVGCSPAKRPAV